MPLRLDGIPLERTYFRLPARLRSTHTCEMLLTCSYSYRSHFKLTASKSQSTRSSPELPICELVRRPSGLRQVFRVVAQTEDFISCLCSTGMIWVVALIEVGVVGTARDKKKKMQSSKKNSSSLMSPVIWYWSTLTSLPMMLMKSLSGHKLFLTMRTVLATLPQYASPKPLLQQGKLLTDQSLGNLGGLFWL